jgi:hypothetical protein
MSSELPTQEEIINHDISTDDDVPVPDWHLAILEERMARYKSEQVEWTPLEEFAKEIEQFRNSLKVKKD